jgi:type II secretory ATPase GspE/PulE/Tfp pilus assembly ATPase PilB-like protein
MDNIVTICSWCKQKARNNKDNWRNITSDDLELEKTGKASHGICPACENEFYKKWGDNDGMDE